MIATGDIVYGQDGDDKITAGIGFKRIDGGAGVDTLVLAETVDIQSIEGVLIDRIEVLSLADADADAIDLDANTIVRMVDGHNDLTGSYDSLVVVGNLGDVIRLHGDFDPVNGTSLDPDGMGSRSFSAFDEGGVLVFVDETVVVEVHRIDTTVHVFGTEFDETLTGGSADELFIGQGGSDSLIGNGGDDGFVFDLLDSSVDGGTGIDTLFLEGSIDLTGVTNLNNIEHIDLTNESSDTLEIDILDLLSFVGDNGLDSNLSNGQKKLVITGDIGDNVILDGTSLLGLATLPANGTVPMGEDPLLDGESYYVFTDVGNSLELYVHTDLVTFI